MPVITLPLHLQSPVLLHLHHLQASLHPREPPIPPLSWPVHCQLITPNSLRQQPPLPATTQSLFRQLSLPLGSPQLAPSSSSSHLEGQFHPSCPMLLLSPQLLLLSLC